nr:integrase, catalytic region, zinc finger, CCHC-type, peptidase aspartic, catalytic [Tanacetum cinerariifolium]GEY45260.1 integrase, catalytic region, zinc finger, CCHC-type, peptidase aspartic, catalytic [Tanacetum cinerariifolium]
MLNKENYVPWLSRRLWYAKSRPNGKLIHNSIINDPYVRRMIPKGGDPNREVPVNKTFYVQTDDELTEKELKHNEANDQAIQTILFGLPKDIYAAVDCCETAQEIWDLNGYNDVQNVKNQVIQYAIQNPRIQNVGNQNGLISVPGNANQNPNRNGNLIAARAEDGSAEVHNYENCYDNEIFNMFTQEEQYTELLESILEPHQVPQNDNNVISEVSSVEQSGRTVEQHPKSVYQEQCLSKKINALHLSSDKEIMTLNEEILELNKQLSMKKSTVSSLLEEKKKLKSDFKIHEDELLDKQIKLEKKIKELENILVKTGQSIQTIYVLTPNLDSFYHTKQKMALGYQNPFYLKQAQQKQQSLYDGKVLLEKHDPPVVHDLEVTLINHFKTSKEEKHVPNKVRERVRTNPIIVSQPPVITKKIVSSDSNGLSSTGVDNTKTRRPQHRSNTKNDKVPSAFKSSRSNNKEVDIKSCLLNYVNGMNSRGKKQKENVTINEHQKKQKPKVKKTKKVGSIERLASPKPSKPRSFLRWSPIRRLFDLKGKIIISSESESQSDCSKGDHAVLLTLWNLQSNGFQILLFLWQVIQICLWCVDSGCSKHMTRNLQLLINFIWKFLGTVRFGNDHVAVILGFSDLQWGNILITRVYFVEGLGHNLFSVGQFCDSDLEVAFRRNACFVRNLEGVNLLKGDRSTNLYTINLYEMASASLICLMARASSTKSWLWHQCLSHLNFDTINDLAKNDLVFGLLKFKYHKEHIILITQVPILIESKHHTNTNTRTNNHKDE